MKFLRQGLQCHRKNLNKMSLIHVMTVRALVSMFYSVNVVVRGSAMYVVIFLGIFLMLSLLSRASTGFSLVVKVL